MVSFLCFIVLSGEGTLSYEEQTYQLDQGDCVFIDCRKAYSHSTSDNLWSLQWCHFYAPSLPAVYEKYKERGGRPVFHPDDLTPFNMYIPHAFGRGDLLLFWTFSLLSPRLLHKAPLSRLSSPAEKTNARGVVKRDSGGTAQNSFYLSCSE